MYDLYNSNIKLIFYYSKIEGRTVEEVRQEQYRNITKLIEQYGETLDNKAHGRNLLTRLIQTGRLKIVGLEDDNNKNARRIIKATLSSFIKKLDRVFFI